jgi:redox-sensitive bicupin YhaK (pirin superfamily)
MMHIRKSQDRGHANHGWLDTYHSFSFADYYDPEQMGFRDLRVINEDHIDGGMGFATHGHRDMEIITYVIEGALEHRDTLGNSTVINPGEVQRMSAGTGIKHSERNPENKKTHLLQIWILPDKEGHTPSYGQEAYTDRIKQKNFILVASRKGGPGVVSMNQDAEMYVGQTKSGDKIEHALKPNRHAWVQVVKGELEVNGATLFKGDGLAVSQEKALKINSQSAAEFIVFDLP